MPSPCLQVSPRPHRWRRALAHALLGFLLLAARPSLAAPPAAAPATERVLVIGDSQAQGLAAGLQWLFRTDRSTHIIDHSKISSGLVSTNVLDWPAEARKLAASEHADIVVVMFGANDRPPVRIHGNPDPHLLAAFTQTYGGRVHDIIATLAQAHMPVVWVGHPIVRDADFSADMATLNGIFATQAAQSAPGSAVFLPLWDVFKGKDGAYDAYGPGPDGATTRLRADDGVHLTPSGYEVAAKLLQPFIEAHRPGVPPPAKPVMAEAPASPVAATIQPAMARPAPETPNDAAPSQAAANPPLSAPPP